MSIVRSLRFAGFLGLIIVLNSNPASAQEPTGASGTGISTQINTFARPGQATMLVNVWGGVGTPGIWRVERTVDLIDLLSVVGVPGIGLEEVGTRSKTYVVIYRTIGGERREAFRRNVKDLLQDGISYPSLQANDVLSIEVERRRRIGLQAISSVVGTTSSIILLVLRLSE
jgi:hypothetical protein